MNRLSSYVISVEQKTMRKMKTIILLATIFTLVCCDNEAPNIKSYIELSQNELIIAPSGETKKIYVTSNNNWVVTNIPDWCVINVNKEIEEPYFEIRILLNEKQSTRNATIKITDGIIEQTLNVIQEANIKVQQINWYTFPINSITSIDYALGNNGVERTYDISGRRLSINEFTKKKIFHGKLINRKLNSLIDIIDYPEYTYNFITVGSFVNGKVFAKTISPSSQEIESLSREIIIELPTQNLQFNYNDSPIKYTSYRQLNLLGNGNLGINLEKAISGHSYIEKEMSKKHGFIYSYSMVLFDIVMDNQKKIVTENITDMKLLADLAYIKSINYGRAAYLLIETDENETNINSLMKKIFKNEALTKNDISLLNKLEAYYLYFDNDLKITVEKGNEAVIKKYISSINNSKIIPLTFSIQSYLDHSVMDISYKVALQ